ncbi:hypothetical protein [Paenibacillus sinensis]|uniref:hypothetical protein n=1 Tax=Paenibacillus sinensis TaxID=2834413 RepID=UPI001CA8C1C9|nr:hypothetical protein [Paenibacillus sinensis]
MTGQVRHGCDPQRVGILLQADVHPMPEYLPQEASLKRTPSLCVRRAVNRTLHRTRVTCAGAEIAIVSGRSG